MNTSVALQAQTRPWSVECPHPLRYVSPDDGLDLGRLFLETTTLPHPSLPTNLSGWIDAALAVLRGDRGRLLDACSFVADGRSGLLGAVVTLLSEGMPRIYALAVAPLYQRQGMGTALVAAAIDALHHAKYPQVQALVDAGSAHARLLAQCGFAQSPGSPAGL